MEGRLDGWLGRPFSPGVNNLLLLLLALVLGVVGLFAFIAGQTGLSTGVERALCVVAVVGGFVTGRLHAWREQGPRKPVSPGPPRKPGESRKKRHPVPGGDVTLLMIAILLPVFFKVVLGFTSWPMFFMGYAAFHIVGLAVSRMAFNPEGRRWRRTVGEQRLAADWAARADRGEG